MNNNVINIQGQRFGRLVVTEYLGNKNWQCICDCGKSHVSTGAHMRAGDVKSCGCLRSDVSRQKATKHNGRNLPEYSVWFNMRCRCADVSNKSYNNYGGRGITVCERWQAFAEFYSDMGNRPSAMHTLERVDNDADYKPDNCKWALRTQQVRNRRNTLKAEFNGITKSIAEWAEEYAIAYSCLKSRIIDMKWNIERALTTPSNEKTKRQHYYTV